MKVSDKIPESMSGKSLEQLENTKSQSVSSKNKNNAKEVASEIAGNSGSAKVRLSERAQDIKKIRQTIDALPDMNEAKIKDLRSKILAGTYKTDPKAIADKMVDEYAYNDTLEVKD